MATVTAFIGKSIRQKQASPFSPRSPAAISHLPPLVVIGASTGGPSAVAHILKALPKTFPAAIVIVQHIDQQFTLSLAKWLDNQSSLPVRVAQAGDSVRSHQVYISKGGHHLVMERDQTLQYVSSRVDTPYRPSVDVFFNSVARHWPKAGQAILLTGMGKDGAAGLGELRSAHWQTVAESKESCVVYGMPKAAIEANAAREVLSIDQIPQRLIETLSLLQPQTPTI